MVAALGIPSLRVPLGLILLAPLLFAVLGVLVPLSLGAQGWGAGRLGALYAAAAVLEAFAHPLLGRWADRRGTLAPVSAGLLGSAGVLAALATTDSPWPVAGLAMAASITFGATFVPGMALLTRAADAAGLDGVLAIALANSRGLSGTPSARRSAAGSRTWLATPSPTWASPRSVSRCWSRFEAVGSSAPRIPRSPGARGRLTPAHGAS